MCWLPANAKELLDQSEPNEWQEFAWARAVEANNACTHQDWSKADERFVKK